MFKNYHYLIFLLGQLFDYYNALRSNCDLATDYVVTQSQATLFGDTHTVQGPMTNQALEFDGDGDYAQFLPHTNFGGGDVSISFQAKWFSTSGFYTRIMDFRKDQEQDNVLITNRDSTNSFQVETRTSDQTSQIKYINNLNNEEITDNVTVEYQNTDGVLNVQRDFCYLGESNWEVDDFFHGQIDEFTIYDYEVTTEQRECIYDICNVNYCSKCNGTSNVCGTCNGNREVPNCDCPVGIYNTNTDICTSCENQCLQCSGSANNCDSCKGDRINSPTCVCPDKYYDDGISTNCIQCSYEGCETCSVVNSCDTCYGSKGLDSSRLSKDCTCPKGYYSHLSLQEECIKCDISCNECDLNGCINCIGNRIKDTTPSQEQQCVCESGGIDHLISLNSYWCTTCTVAVITAKFSNDYKQIIVQFYGDIDIPNYEDNLEQQSGTNSLCQFIFDEDLLVKLGQNSKCRLDVDSQQIIIFLGLQPTIINMIDYITFKQNVIQRSGCPSNQFLNEYQENILQLGDVPLPPSSELILPTSKVNLCQQIDIQFTNIINDGLRGLKNLIWSIDSTDSTDTQQIQQLLDNQNQNNNKAIFLLIPMLTLQEYKTYQMQVQYENFAGIIGITKFTIETLSTRGTYAKIQQTQPFVFKNWKQNELVADVNFLDCESGALQYIDRTLQVDWVDITSNPNNSTPLIRQNTEPKEKISIYQIEKYASVPGLTYTIEIRVNIPGEPLMESKHFVEYLVEESELLVYIEGGNRLQAYANELDLQGQALDIDVPVQNQKDGISLDWDCINIMNQEQCKNIGGVEIPLGTSDSLHYEKKIFEPYTSYLFTLTGDNGTKSNSGQAIIIVVETDLPVLTVSIPQQVRNQKINKNDDLEMQIISSQDPDEAFYSLIIIYKYEVVATKSYNYNIFAFQIWDIYNDFQTDESEFIIRVSVYDPQYFMPSQSSFTTNVNFPPIAGTITINPTSGIALDTEFTIICENFYDEDQPLTYKYSYYTQVNHYQKEIQQGGKQISVYKNILQDFTNKNIFETTLPSGLGNDILLLVTVQDSLGGITNVTETIQVQKYSEDINQNLERLETLYQESLNLDQEQKLSSINLFVQEIGQIFLSDDRLTYSNKISDQSVKQQFMEFKKTVYDDLMNYVGNIFSKVLEDQVLKSINILQNVGGNLSELQSDEEIDSQIIQINDIVKDQQKTLNDLITQNLVNQGDNIVTKKLNSIIEILGKIMQFIDKLSSNLSQKNQNQRILTEEQINQQQQIYTSTKLLQETIQLTMLPNSDLISYHGENISQEVQVLTQKNLQNKYFQQESQGLSLFNQNFSEEDLLNSDTKQGAVYKSSGSAFKSNPFIKDKGFPYKNQNTIVQDIDITEDGESSDQEIQIKNQEVSMFFDRGDSKQDSNNVCIQKKKGDDQQDWKVDTCITEESVENKQIKCKCKGLTPTTVIDDIDYILANNQVDEVFSDEGINALADFKFWKSVIFYVYILKCIGIIFAIYYGHKKDQKEIENQKQKLLDNMSQKSKNDQKLDQDQKNNQQETQDVPSYNTIQNIQSNMQQDDNKNQQFLHKSSVNQDDKNDNYVCNQIFEKFSYKDNSNNEQNYNMQNLETDTLGDFQMNLNKQKRKRTRQSFNSKIYNLEQEPEEMKSSQPVQNKSQQKKYEVNLNNNQFNNQEQQNQEKDYQQQQNQDIVQVQQNLEEEEVKVDQIQQNQEKYQYQFNKEDQDQQNQGNVQEIQEEQVIKNQNQQNDYSQRFTNRKNSSRYLLPSQKSSKIYNFDEKESQDQNSDKQLQQQQQLNMSSGEIECSQSDYQNINIENIKNEKKQEIKKQPSEALFVFHSFFGIYLVFNENLSRPARYILYFIRINLLIAISALFSQEMSQYQSLLFSILASVILALPCALLQTLLKSKNQKVKILGVILSLIIFIIALYVVLVTAALMGVDKSNQWTISYISAFSIDTFCLELIQGYSKVYILKNQLFKPQTKYIKTLFGDKSIINYLMQK